MIKLDKNPLLTDMLIYVQEHIKTGDYDPAANTLRKIGEHMAKRLIIDAGLWKEACTDKSGRVYDDPNFGSCIYWLNKNRIITKREYEDVFIPLKNFGNDGSHTVAEVSEISVKYANEKTSQYVRNTFVPRFPDSIRHGILPNIEGSVNKSKGGFTKRKSLHVHTKSDWSVLKKPSCTNNGEEVITCLECGELLDRRPIPAKGHILSDWIVDRRAQEGLKGLKHKECKVCGDVIQRGEISALPMKPSSKDTFEERPKGTKSLRLSNGKRLESSKQEKVSSSQEKPVRKNISPLYKWSVIIIIIAGVIGFVAGRISGSNNVTVGSIVKFGAYEQDGDLTNGNEPIEWIVVEKDDDIALVVSKNCLDVIPYGNAVDENAWTNSGIRDWLNNRFIQESFSEYEKSHIVVSDIETNSYDSNSWYDNWEEAKVVSAEHTKDAVIILDSYEINEYYYTEIHYTDVSPYAAKKYAMLDSEEMVKQDEFNYFWLRNTIKGSDYGGYALCAFGGKPNILDSSLVSGLQFPERYAYIRPAMRINVKDLKND